MTDAVATLRLLIDGVRLLEAGHTIAARSSIMTALEHMAAAGLSPAEMVQAARLTELQRHCENGVARLEEIRTLVLQAYQMAMMADHGCPAGHA